MTNTIIISLETTLLQIINVIEQHDDLSCYDRLEAINQLAYIGLDQSHHQQQALAAQTDQNDEDSTDLG